MPTAAVKLFKHNSMGVTVMNQRRFVRWAVEQDSAVELVLPAKVLTSNSSSALHGCVKSLASWIGLRQLRELSEKARASLDLTSDARPRCQPIWAMLLEFGNLSSLN